MTIHHSQLKKAEKAGYTLTEDGDTVVAFWPKRALRIVGASTADAMTQMQAAIAILSSNPDVSIRINEADPRLISVYDESNGMRLAGGPVPPFAAHAALLKDDAEWEDPVEMTGNFDTPEAPEDDPAKAPVERINGIAIDGAVAFAEGTPAGDCPYSSEGDDDGDNGDSDEYDNFIRWNEEWDAAADAKSEEEGEDAKGGSVVSEKYRAKYAEAGHPTHCGDWLAETMNEICLNKAGTNLELFEAICGLNGVDTGKYRREGVGWQGRIRMTGRNLLAKKIYLAGGKLILPDTLGGFKMAPAEWMATQRYKMPAAQQSAPIPTAE